MELKILKGRPSIHVSLLFLCGKTPWPHSLGACIVMQLSALRGRTRSTTGQPETIFNNNREGNWKRYPYL